MDYQTQIQRWQEESHPSVPAVVSISSAGWYAGGMNIWWRLRYQDEDRKVQNCVLRSVTLIGNQIHGHTTTISPRHEMFASNGVHWDDTYEVLLKKQGWFRKYQDDLVNGGLYAICTQHGLDIVRPTINTQQPEINYEQQT